MSARSGGTRSDGTFGPRWCAKCSCTLAATCWAAGYARSIMIKINHENASAERLISPPSPWLRRQAADSPRWSARLACRSTVRAVRTRPQSRASSDRCSPDPIVRPSTDSTGTTSAPVPQTNTSRAVQTSNRLNGRSSYGIPSSLAISSTVSRVMPSRFVAVARRRQAPTRDDENVVGRGLGDVAVHVQHQRFVGAVIVGFHPREHVVHVVQRLDRRAQRVRRRPPERRRHELDALRRLSIEADDRPGDHNHLRIAARARVDAQVADAARDDQANVAVGDLVPPARLEDDVLDLAGARAARSDEALSPTRTVDRCGDPA